MAKVYIPPSLRELTGQQEIVEAAGTTVRAVLADLEPRYPGLTARLCDQDMLRPGLMVAVAGRMSKQGLRTPVPDDAEIHFLPALGGG
jgi:sulfur-carrier protein